MRFEVFTATTMPFCGICSYVVGRYLPAFQRNRPPSSSGYCNWTW